MQLTRFTDLGLRTMMLLAAGDADDRRVTTRTIAAGADASENHVAKAVARLAELGMVNARRGRVGGLSLTDAGRTRLIDMAAAYRAVSHDLTDLLKDLPR